MNAKDKEIFTGREAAIGGVPTVDVSRLGSRAYARDSFLCDPAIICSYSRVFRDIM